MGKCDAGSVAAGSEEEAAKAAEDSTARACPWVDIDERGAGASAEPSIVSSQFESVDGTVGLVGRVPQVLLRTGWVVRSPCVFELSAVRARPWVDERGAGTTAEPRIVNSQFESVDGTVGRLGPVGSSAIARFVGD